MTDQVSSNFRHKRIIVMNAKPITPTLHGIIDYTFSATLLAVLLNYRLAMAKCLPHTI